VQQHVDAGVLGEVVPGELERLRLVGHPGAGAVGVGALEGLALVEQPSAHLPADPAHDALAGAGRVEAVEGVEDRGPGAAEVRGGLDEQGARAGPRRCDGRRRAR
jgi:hypothetical protein